MLQDDPASDELRQLRAQLQDAVQQLQAGLLDLKKQRMLMEVDALRAGAAAGPSGAEDPGAAAARAVSGRGTKRSGSGAASAAGGASTPRRRVARNSSARTRARRPSWRARRPGCFRS